jgi:hypothetical protein
MRDDDRLQRHLREHPHPTRARLRALVRAEVRRQLQAVANAAAEMANLEAVEPVLSNQLAIIRRLEAVEQQLTMPRPPASNGHHDDPGLRP